MSWLTGPLVLLCLCLTVAPVHGQASAHDSFIIQYLERRLLQMEERLSHCEQKILSATRKNYDISSELRGFQSTLAGFRSEVGGLLEGVSARLERVEGDVEYLEKKVLTQTDIEMEEALLEEHVRAAEREQQEIKAEIKVEKDCSAALTQIKSLKIVKKAADVHGSWFKDQSGASDKVYLLSGIRNQTVLEFESLQSFTESPSPQAKALRLPEPWQGTGQALHGGFLFYHKADTHNQILKVNLHNASVVDSTFLQGAGRLPAYGLNPNTYLDMAVDELGLWAIHADPEYGGNLVITKLNRETLAVQYTWDTRCRSRDAEGAFLICGTLYVVYNTHYGGRSTIQCLYDIHDTVRSPSGESPLIFFPKRDSSHSSIHYHPAEKQLYAWDEGYQTVYKVKTRKSVRAGAN